jgi:hypothetical protein
MSDYVTTVSKNLVQEAYEDNVRFYSDVDSFSQQSQLSLANARATMQYLHVNNIKGISLFGSLAVTMHTTDTYQFQAFAYRSPDSINVPTLGAEQDEVTDMVQWLTTPTSQSVLTIVNGFVTALTTGTVSIYAKLGSFTTVASVITVS